jgi:Xaa-Pro aminopeptidase
VAGGKNACTLHNVSNTAPLNSGELVVCDVGAEVSHYAADITRTVCVGKPSARQKAIYAAVLDVQAYALTLLKPGANLKKYEQQVAKRMGEELKNLGLVKRADKKSVRKYFPHATSHFLGLNVHDVGDYQVPLEPGMVLTCEPGIYIPEEGIGVRLEDDVLITKSGNKVLSAACAKRLSSLH